MKGGRICLTICILILVAPTVLSAFAEVTSLQTDATFYRGGQKINFSGTTLSTDSSGITLVIFDPNNNFVTLESGFTDSNHAFQIILDTSTPENQQKFSLKGTYNATAFIQNKTQGRVISFDFSPDGSLIVHQPTVSQNSGSNSSTSGNSQPTQSSTPTSTQTPGNPQPSQSLNDILQQRYEEARKLKQLLDEQNTRQKSVTLVESLGVGDRVADMGINKISIGGGSNSVTDNFGINFDHNNIIYVVIVLVGVGIVLAVFYYRKRQPPISSAVTINNEGSIQQTEPVSSESDYDYAIMILKNRLAKGEITVEEFRSLRDALNEP